MPLRRFSPEEHLRALRSFPFQADCCHFDQVAWHTVCNSLFNVDAEGWSVLEMRKVTTDLLDDLMESGLVERDMVNQDDFWYRATDAGNALIQTGGSFIA